VSIARLSTLGRVAAIGSESSPSREFPGSMDFGLWIFLGEKFVEQGFGDAFGDESRSDPSGRVAPAALAFEYTRREAMIVYISTFKELCDECGNHLEGDVGRFAGSFTSLMDLSFEERGDAGGTGFPARGISQRSLFEPGEIHRLGLGSPVSLRVGIAGRPVRQHGLHATKSIAHAT